MSYETFRDLLDRCKRRSDGSPEPPAELIEALEILSDALESDLTQIKGALSHVAHLLESQR